MWDTGAGAFGGGDWGPVADIGGRIGDNVGERGATDIVAEGVLEGSKDGGELYLWGIVESGMSDLLVVIVPGVGVIERGEGETEWEGFLSRREGTLLVSVSGVEMDIRRWEKSRSGSGLQRDSYQSGEEKKESERCG